MEGQHAAAWSLRSGQHTLAMGADRFFMDGRLYDPQTLAEYVSGFEITRSRAAAGRDGNSGG
jgi:hypothetical protein